MVLLPLGAYQEVIPSVIDKNVKKKFKKSSHEDWKTTPITKFKSVVGWPDFFTAPQNVAPNYNLTHQYSASHPNH